MKIKIHFLLLVSVLLVIAKSVSAQLEVLPNYGSKFDGATATVSIFTNETKVGFDIATPALMALGYFDDGYDIQAGADSVINGLASLGSFLEHFNHLDSDNFTTANAPGFVTIGTAFEEKGVGKDAYIMTLAGVDEWDQSTTATEIGLFRNDDFFGKIPGGEEPTPASYEIANVRYENVIVGKEWLNEELSGLFEGNLGNLYATQMQISGKAIPEPSTYALFLGVFSLGFVIWRKRAVKNTAKQ
jgi:hypothetical protein